MRLRMRREWEAQRGALATVRRERKYEERAQGLHQLTDDELDALVVNLESAVRRFF
jgi:hypothetical protein